LKCDRNLLGELNRCAYESIKKIERERVAGYILRAPLSQEKRRYLEEKDQVIYQSGKKGSEKKVFTALDWLAALTAHIPNRGEQMVRYYGWYSNKRRGIRKKATQDRIEEPMAIQNDPISTLSNQDKEKG
jgi:hypothetical protein